MILESLKVSVQDFEARSGWKLEARGACKGNVCVPLDPKTKEENSLNVRLLADRLRMPLVYDAAHLLWSLGPESGTPALISANAPPLVLKTMDGELFRLSDLLGQKVLLVAWASW